MYARMVLGSLQPEKVDEFVEFWRENVLRTAQQQRGFKGVRLMVDRKNGKVVSSGLWATEADLHNSTTWNQAQVEKVMSQFGSFFTAPPEVGLYEVVVDV
jgi:quinol monooxygenase YgiN